MHLSGLAWRLPSSNTTSHAFATPSCDGLACSDRFQFKEVNLVHSQIYGQRGVSPVQRLLIVRASQYRNVDDISGTVKALQSRNRFPKKWLGQHYMVNEGVNGKVVNAAQITPGDLVVEIGPGTGSLTKALVAAGAHVIAIEKDPDMASLMAERFSEGGQVEVVHQDFLKWPVRNQMAKFMEKASLATGQTRLAKVVSNLPFNITTNVIKRLLPMGDVFSHVVLLLQDEAAIRLVDASPASEDYRPISFVVNFFSVPEYKFKVPRKAFFPQPRVDGGVVCFQLKKESEYPSVPSIKTFFSMVNSAFNGKRKMLRNTLQHLFTPSNIQAALSSVGLPETARPEELTLDQFVAFYNEVTAKSALDGLVASIPAAPAESLSLE